MLHYTSQENKIELYVIINVQKYKKTTFSFDMKYKYVPTKEKANLEWLKNINPNNISALKSLRCSTV